jgi:hypothetical protein
MYERTTDPNDSACVEDDSWPEESHDPIPDRPPIALISVSRALSRRWQGLDKTLPLSAPEANEHYLSELSGLTKLNEALAPDVDPELLAELGAVMLRRLRARLRASRRAQGQLRREIAALAELLKCHGLATASPSTDRQPTSEEGFFEKEEDLACASVG